MIKLQVLANPNNGVDLFMLGVPERFHNGSPSPAAFPKRFNPNAKYVWEEMLKSDYYLVAIKGKDADTRWNLAITNYLKACDGHDEPAFVGNIDRSDNNEVISWLRNARHKVVRYLNTVKIFDFVKADREKGDWLELHQEEGSLILRSNLDIQWKGTHYDLNKYLTNLGFAPYSKGGRVLYKFLDPSVRVYCKIINSAHATLYYEMKVGSNIYYPSDVAPNKTEYHDYIVRYIWQPLVLAQRFDNLPRRWKF